MCGKRARSWLIVVVGIFDSMVDGTILVVVLVLVIWGRRMDLMVDKGTEYKKREGVILMPVVEKLVMWKNVWCGDGLMGLMCWIWLMYW